MRKMLISDLIEELYELKRANGNLEVKLLTQRDAWSWEEYDIHKVYCSDHTYTKDYAIFIEGEDLTTEEEDEEETEE